MKKVLYPVFVFALLTSCVTKQRYSELSKKYDNIHEAGADLVKQNDELVKDKISLLKEVRLLERNEDYFNNQTKILKEEIETSLNKYYKLKESYDALLDDSSYAISTKAEENQKLMSELEEKENRLFQEEANLKKMQVALESRSQRIQELEVLIAKKEAAMQGLKSAISDALKGFEGKGLTVVQRDGKVYVSMENKLLFKPGQWAVGKSGQGAVMELAKVLVQNPTINVLIEGHTDNDPYKKGGVIKDNWDLSVKRATAIVRILQNSRVSPKQITAAGRSEYLPVMSNETKEGKAKNRRIEIVLSPNLDEVTKLLNE